MGGRSRDGTDRKVAVTTFLECVEFIHELAVSRQRAGGVAQREKAQLVGSHAARQAIEQPGLQDLFDVHQDLGGRRLRDVHLLCRQAQVAGLTQDVQKLQMPETQARAGLCEG